MGRSAPKSRPRTTKSEKIANNKKTRQEGLKIISMRTEGMFSNQMLQQRHSRNIVHTCIHYKMGLLNPIIN